jgi:hypothetical protein
MTLNMSILWIPLAVLSYPFVVKAGLTLYTVIYYPYILTLLTYIDGALLPCCAATVAYGLTFVATLPHFIIPSYHHPVIPSSCHLPTYPSLSVPINQP